MALDKPAAAPDFAVLVEWEHDLTWPDHLATGTHLRVELSPDFNRQPHPDVHVEALVQTRWHDLLARKPPNSVWNATKFRLAAIEASHNATILQLGLTDYREYQGTNLSSPNPLGVWTHPRHLSNAFGNACVVETSDAKVLFLVRGSRVGEGTGRVVLPGGHAEPSRIGLKSVEQSWSHSPPDPLSVLREIHDAIVDEVLEELYVKREDLAGSLKLKGVVARVSDGKAQIVGAVQLRLSADEAISQWNHARGSDSEGVEILALPHPDVAHALRSGTVRGVALMPEHRGALQFCVPLSARLQHVPTSLW